uniref:BRICHOS domain containing 5 n=1 Tax=Neogobius melanostomus TaxID=47308 RepID=A0A8C6U3N3_9GOBI
SFSVPFPSQGVLAQSRGISAPISPRLWFNWAFQKTTTLPPDVVTFYVASAANQTSTVLFDTRHGLICYKPAHQKACFLQKMEESDYDNVQCYLTANETLRQTEFLSVVGSSPVDMSTLDEPLQQLCQDGTVHWTHKTDGPGKQRLVYFCIDICFPSNICVSVCFYYLPE